MAAISSLIIKDGQATPADHTFQPYSPQVGSTQRAVWLEKSNASPVGYLRAEASVLRNSNGVYKASIDIFVPTLAVVAAGCCVDTNTPVVSYTHIANMKWSIPPGSTLANRNDLLAFSKNILSSAMAVNLITNLEPSW